MHTGQSPSNGLRSTVASSSSSSPSPSPTSSSSSPTLCLYLLRTAAFASTELLNKVRGAAANISASSVLNNAFWYTYSELLSTRNTLSSTNSTCLHRLPLAKSGHVHSCSVPMVTVYTLPVDPSTAYSRSISLTIFASIINKRWRRAREIRSRVFCELARLRALLFSAAAFFIFLLALFGVDACLRFLRGGGDDVDAAASCSLDSESDVSCLVARLRLRVRVDLQLRLRRG
mmetsp:Transcript_39802/g.65163  ORF Transcript_39802/g.65163 Transcript_39802/m.65163 type:complete len:231 (-) Transcript_39802:560-1252(-)